MSTPSSRAIRRTDGAAGATGSSGAAGSAAGRAPRLIATTFSGRFCPATCGSSPGPTFSTELAATAAVFELLARDHFGPDAWVGSTWFGAATATNLFTVHADGTDLRPITAYGDAEPRATYPTWTPDGSAIAFTLVVPSGIALTDDWGDRRVAFVAPDGSDLRVIEDRYGMEPRVRPVP